MPYAIENGEVYKPSKMPEGTVVVVDGHRRYLSYAKGPGAFK
jgi:hypothetical protein